MKNVKIIIYLHLDFAKTQESIREPIFTTESTENTENFIYNIFFSVFSVLSVVFFKFSFIDDFMIIILK